MRRSYKIALASVSCALAVIAVVAQAFVSTLSIAINVIAALAISLPLTQKSVGGAIFSYVAAALIGFFAVNVKALPFIMFYAPYSIVAYALDFILYPSEKIALPKWVKIALITVVKLGFFGAAFYGCLTLMKVVIADISLFGLEWTLPVLMAFGFAAFCAYDPLYRLVFVNLRKIVGKYVGGYRRNQGKPDNAGESAYRVEIAPDDGDVFDGFGDKRDRDGKADKDERDNDGNDKSDPDAEEKKASADGDGSGNEG